jgi:hypothetical protein
MKGMSRRTALPFRGPQLYGELLSALHAVNPRKGMVNLTVKM